MIWKIVFLLILFFFLLIFIMGRYRFTGKVKIAANQTIFRFSIRSFLNLLGLEWNRIHERNLLHIVLLGIRIPFKRRAGAQRSMAKLPKKHRFIDSHFFSLAMIQRILKRFVRLLSRFELDRMSFCGIVGLGDPAATGFGYGLLQSVKYAFPKKINLDIQPDFGGKKLEGQMTFTLHFYLFSLFAFVFNSGLDYLRFQYFKQR